MTFQGFPAETLVFLNGIAQNNNKRWFEEHRADYENYWLEPAKDFVIAAGESLRLLVPGIRAEPRVLGSIMRINRDTRFSADKRPYKDHLDLWFWEGDRKEAVGGLFFRLTPEMVGVGVGSHGFAKDVLSRFRDAVADSDSGKKLVDAVRQVEDAGYEVRGQKNVRTPPGYPVLEPERERLLRFSALWAVAERTPDSWVHSPEVLEWAMAKWTQMLPLYSWLASAIAP